MPKSVLKRMLILPLLLLIPVNILVIFISCLNLRSGERELMMSRQGTLDLMAAQVDRDIREADQYILTYLNSNDAMLRLCQYQEMETDQLDFYLDMMEVLQTIESFLTLQTNIQGVYLHLPWSEREWKRGEIPDKAMEQLEVMYTEENPDAQRIDLIWREENGSQLITLFAINKDSWTGYRLSLEEYAGNDKEVFFAGTSGEYEEILRKEKNKIILSGKSTMRDMVFAFIYERQLLFDSISGLLYWLLAASIASVIVAPVLIFYYYRRIFRPTAALEEGIARVRLGNPSYRVPVLEDAGNNEFVDLTRYFNEMLDELQAARMSAYELKLHQQKMKLDYYSQQIRPHFILNALNEIYTSRQEEWPQTKETILYLTRYFRYIVNVDRQFVRLDGEMEFLENYLKLQSRRLEKHFFYVVSWEHTLADQKIPPLILCTFVENSIKYALAPGVRRCIAVTAEQAGNRLRLKIFDGGDGFPPEVLRDLKEFLDCQKISGRLGVGIVNAVERLRMLYGEEVSVFFGNENGAVVQIEFPMDEGEEDEDVSDTDRR